ncbi:hypothetical protein [Mycolicibacterium llatzerense]|uniref:hypothetical protein n=1 Tax=Mycolicibacterium llatzerense TaxID=280871 RepID=UPI0021B6AEB0|nr:hypothetical protein [Mycolicibacterium llatzerense]
MIEIRVPVRGEAAPPGLIVALAQPRVAVKNSPIIADSTHLQAGTQARRQRLRGGNEHTQRDTRSLSLQPLLMVAFTYPRTVAAAGPLTIGDRTPPPIDQMIARDDNHVVPIERIEPRRRDQGSQ